MQTGILKRNYNGDYRGMSGPVSRACGFEPSDLRHSVAPRLFLCKSLKLSTADFETSSHNPKPPYTKFKYPTHPLTTLSTPELPLRPYKPHKAQLLKSKRQSCHTKPADFKEEVKLIPKGA